MARTVAIGHQDFEHVVINNYFYVDKTNFIREWWEKGDAVTLITRPRRFGKTLNMSMLELFFSVEYEKRSDLFENLKIWEYDEYRELQGTYPVISLTFAGVKEVDFSNARKKLCQNIRVLYNKYDFLLQGDLLNEEEKQYFRSISAEMEDYIASDSLKNLSLYLKRYYGKKVIILLDEYDTPMQEAYVNGYWEELTAFYRNLFHAAFKTNPYLERALMTGITRISKESVFSDLNNLEVVTTTSEAYETSFGFTEEEVFDALEEYGLSEKKELVKKWYDGFVFGKTEDIYNPWSIINFLDKRKEGAYWANTSSNSLVGKLMREGNRQIKLDFERLISGETFVSEIDEQIVFSQLDSSECAVWSLLLASGYLKTIACRKVSVGLDWKLQYELKLTNFEVLTMFRRMVREWFGQSNADYNDFLKAMLLGDVDAMNEYMNRVALATFSYFDTGSGSGKQEEPERFYHGFVLGLMVDLAGKYRITSNRESGFGRYDVILKPLQKSDPAVIMEFKVRNRRKEKTLEDTAENALKQIEEKRYQEVLLEEGILEENILKYGFAFQGKKVLIES